MVMEVFSWVPSVVWCSLLMREDQTHHLVLEARIGFMLSSLLTQGSVKRSVIHGFNKGETWQC